MALSAWRKWWRGKSAAAKPQRKKSFFRKCFLEILEDRTLLSNVYTVNLAGDAGTGSGTSGDIRYCINQANQNNNSVIDLTNTATAIGSNTIYLSNGQLQINDNMTIIGPGADSLTISGNPPLSVNPTNAASRVFDINSNTANVKISGLTIASGNAAVTFTTNTGAFGGDIYNGGNLQLSNDIVTNGLATNGTGGPDGEGGAIFNAEGASGSTGSTLILDNTTVEDSHAIGSGGSQSFAGYGGGIYNDTNATVTIENGSQIINNTAESGGGGTNSAGGSGYGGGVYNNHNATLVIDGSAGTIAFTDDVAQGGAGGPGGGGGGGGKGAHGGNGGNGGNAGAGGLAAGGAVFNTGTITIQDAQFEGNQANGGKGGAGGHGGNGGTGTAVTGGSGGNGGAGGAGGNAQGGGIYNATGAVALLNLLNCQFTTDSSALPTPNEAIAGIGGTGGTAGNGGLSTTNPFQFRGAVGGAGGLGGAGGSAEGGAVYNSAAGGVTFTSSPITSSLASGGKAGLGGGGGVGGIGGANGLGGSGGLGGGGGLGGNASGGGIFNTGGGNLTIMPAPTAATGTTVVYSGNQALAGSGNTGGAGGTGGLGGNYVTGGRGGGGGGGGTGGNAQGGGFYDLLGSVTVSDSNFQVNQAVAGNAAAGGAGGNGGQGADNGSGRAGNGGAAGAGGNGGAGGTAHGGAGGNVGSTGASTTLTNDSFTSSLVQTGKAGDGGAGGTGGAGGNGVTANADGIGGSGGNAGNGGDGGAGSGGAIYVAASSLNISGNTFGNSSTAGSENQVIAGAGGAGGLGGTIGTWGHPNPGRYNIDRNAGNGGNGGDGGVVSGGAVATSGTTPISSSISTQWNGLNYISGGSDVPPDPQGAAGPNNYVETTNQEIALYDLTGNTVGVASLAHFFTVTGKLPPPMNDGISVFSDPSVTYDAQIGAFIVTDLNVDSSLINPHNSLHKSVLDIAVSTSAKPGSLGGGSWKFYQISTAEAGFDPDYPGNLGWNADGLFVTLNMLSVVPENPGHVQVDAIPNTILTGPSGTLLTAGTNFIQADVAGAANLRPTVMQDSTAGGPMWLVEEGGDDQSINVIQMTPDFTNYTATFTTTNIAVTPYSQPVPEQDPGGVITDTTDSRLTNAVMANGMIVTAQTVSDTAGDIDEIQWYEIDTTKAKPTLQQQGDVSGPSGTYYAVPSIAINSTGDIALSYIASGTVPGQYMSAYVTGWDPSSDAAGTMETPVLVQAGINHNIDTVEGEYSAISVDPTDGSFWIAGEITDSDWATVIANFTVPLTLPTPFSQPVIITNSTFEDHTIEAGNAGVSGAGGLFSLGGQFNGFNGIGGNGGLASGGTISLTAASAQDATLTNDTITGSIATSGTGGAGNINNDGGIGSAGGDGGNVEGVGMTAAGYNVSITSSSVDDGVGTAGLAGVGGGSNVSLPDTNKGGAGGNGGSAMGGSVFFSNSLGTTLSFSFTGTGSDASDNQLIAGSGGMGGNAGRASGTTPVSGGSGGNGGVAQGGGLYIGAGSTSVNLGTLANLTLSVDILTSGIGGSGGAGAVSNGGIGGSGGGGAVYDTSLNPNTSSTLSLTAGAVYANQVTARNGGTAGSATTPNGGAGGSGGDAGTAAGGGFYDGNNVAATVVNSTFGGFSAGTIPLADANVVRAGYGGVGGDAGVPTANRSGKNDGGPGGNGGNVEGGNIYTASTANTVLTNDTLVYGQALVYGMGGAGGSGAGIGGQPGVAGSDGLSAGGGAFAAPGSTDTLANTIVALNAAGITFSPNLVPSAIKGTPYSQTITASGGNGSLTMSYTIAFGTIPTGLTITPTGNTLKISGTPTATGSVTLNVTATDSYGNQETQSYVVAVNAASTAITLSPGTLPSGIIGTAYNQTITASGNGTVTVQPVQPNNIVTGSLPPGLSFSYPASNKVTISGTPTADGYVAFNVIASDSAGDPTITQTYILAINGGADVYGTFTSNGYNLITNTTGATGFNTGVGGHDKIVTAATLKLGPLQNNGGSTLTDALLPGSAAIDAGSNTLIATDPSTGQPYVNDQRGPGISFNLTTIPSARVGQVYNQTITASSSNGGLSVTDVITSGTLPAGLTIIPSGSTLTISGTPTAPGTFSFKVTASDGYGNQFVQSYTLTVNPATTLTLTPSTLLAATEGIAYNATITAGGGSGTLSVTDILPDNTSGLNFNIISGGTLKISGTPTAAGTFSFSVTAQDSAGDPAFVQNYTLVINAPSSNGYLRVYPPTTGKVDVGAYEYQLPIINSMGPNNADEQSGGFTLTIYGSGFEANPTVGATTVSFNGGPALTPTTIAPNEITVTIPGPMPDEDDSPVPVTVTIPDGSGVAGKTLTSAASPFVINEAATLTLTAPANFTGMKLDEAQVVNLPAVTSSDPDTTFSITAGNLPPGLSIGLSSGVISGTIATYCDGTYTFTIGGTDDGLVRGTLTFTWTVLDTSPPSFTAPPTQTNNEGDTITPVATSPVDADAGSITASNLPTGLSIDSTTGVISGTIGLYAAGTYTVTVSGKDGDNTTNPVGSTTFTWKVNDTSPPSFTNPGPQTSDEGAVIAGLNLKPVDADAGSITATGLPTGLSIDSTTGIISGTIGTYAAGTYNVTVSGKDSDSTHEVGSTSFTWTVKDTSPPSFTGLVNQTSDEGQAVSLTFTPVDADPGSVTVTGLPTGFTFDSNTDTISGTWGKYAAGTYSITVSATDSDSTNPKGSTTITWTVLDTTPPSFTAPPTQTNNEGDTITPVATSPVDADAGSITASNLPTGLSIDSTTGVISGTIGLYAAGTYNVTVSGTDGDNTTDPVGTTSFKWIVNDTSPPSFTNPGPQTSDEGAVIAGLNLDPVDADAGSITATGLPTGLSIDSTSGIISGTIGTYAAGTYTVTISGKDSDSTHVVGTTSFQWIVNDTSPPSFTNPGIQTSNEGAVIAGLNLNPVDADAGSITATGLPTGLSIDSTTGIISGTIGLYAAGTYTVTVSGKDSDSTHVVGTTSFIWTVNDTSPPSFTNPGTQTSNEGAVIAGLNLKPVDADAGSITATGLPTGLSIDSTTGIISGTIGTYAAGTYTVTVSGKDSDSTNVVGSTTFTWTVNDTSPPSFTNPGTLTNNEGDSVSLALDPVDTDAGSITATGLPTGLRIDSTTGGISGTIGAYAAGTYTVTVSGKDSDSSNPVGSTTFQWIVNDTSPPSFTNPGAQTSDEGAVIAGLNLKPVDADAGSITATGLPTGLSIDSTTGIISGTIGAYAAGTYTVTVSGKDSDSTNVVGSTTFTWTVNDTTPPSFTGVTNQTNNEGDKVSLTLHPVDSDPDNVTVTGLPSGLSFDPSTNVISGTIGLYAAGTYTINLGATDGTLVGKASFTWTVNATTPPSFTNPGNQTINEGATINLALDPVGADAGTITAIGLPSGLSIDSTSGVISGTVGKYSAGTYPVTVSATHGKIKDSINFSFIIAHTTPPSLTNPGNQTNNEGDTVNLALTTVDSEPVVVTATGLPLGLNINSTTGVISGTIDPYGAGIYSTNVYANDGTLSSHVTFTWTVNDSTPPSFTNAVNQTYNEGDAVNVDLDPVDADPGSITATGLPAGLSIDSTSGIISGTLGSYSAGTYKVTVSGTDGTIVGRTTFTWTINAVTPPSFTNPGNQTINEGATVNVNLDPLGADPGSITASGLPSGLSINSTSGVISGTVGKYSAGSYAVTVSATRGTIVGSTTFNFIIDHTTPPSLTNPGNQTSNEGDSVNVKLNPVDSEPVTITATGLPAGLSIDPTSGVITGTIGKNAAGSYAVTVKAADSTLSSSVSFTWTVNAVVFAPPSFTNPGTQTNKVGDTASVALNPVNADAGSITATGLPAGLSIDSTTGVITGTLSNNSAGTYTVTVSATDGTVAGSTTFTWKVNAVTSTPPSFTNPGTQTNSVGDTVNVALDPVNADAGSITATGLPAGLSIDSTTGVISGTLANNSAGTYTVTVSATDGTVAGSTTFTWIVNAIVSPPPSLPSFTNPGTRTNNEGNSVSVGLNPVNADPGSITAVGLPAGLSINSTTGVISGTVFALPGTYTVTVSASDRGVVNHVSFPWVVNQSPAVIVVSSIQNTYAGLNQVETITALVTDAAGIPINQGVVTFQLNGQTVTAAVSNGVATANIITPLLSFDLTILLSDFFSHALSVSYSDSQGIFGFDAASVMEEAMLLDFFLFLFGEGSR